MRPDIDGEYTAEAIVLEDALSGIDCRPREAARFAIDGPHQSASLRGQEQVAIDLLVADWQVFVG